MNRTLPTPSTIPFGACLASLRPLSFDAASTRGEAVQDGVNRLILAPITLEGHEDSLATSVGVATSSEDDDCHHRYDLQNVATHEAGHFFGLEDYDDQATTMYVSSKPCQTSKRTLSPLDVSVISNLYEAPTARASSCTLATGGVHR